MERQSSKRRWTVEEDEALRQSARCGRLAGPCGRWRLDCGRSYLCDAMMKRASRLGAIRLERSDPAERAARGPTEIPCRYCGGAFLSRGSVRYCGRRSAGPWPGGQCPGCGRAVGQEHRCSRCAVDGKRSDWPAAAA